MAYTQALKQYTPLQLTFHGKWHSRRVISNYRGASNVATLSNHICDQNNMSTEGGKMNFVNSQISLLHRWVGLRNSDFLITRLRWDDILEIILVLDVSLKLMSFPASRFFFLVNITEIKTSCWVSPNCQITFSSGDLKEQSLPWDSGWS